MWNTKVLDINDDNGELLKTLIDWDSLPEQLKTASISSPLYDDGYALSIQNGEYKLNKFACNTPENTALSLIYFLNHYDKLTDDQIKTAAVNLVNSANEFNLYIPEELKRLAEELKSHRSGSEVRTRSKFKTQDTLDGAEENAGIKLATIMDHYPVETYEQVEMAKQYFSRYLTEFEPQERHKFASELKERMSLLKIASTKDLDSYAGTDYGDVDTHLIKRKDYLPEEEKNTIDLFIEKRAYVSPECFAEALLDFDQFTGLNKYWDRGIKDPYYTTFAKTAEKKEWRYKTDTGAYISEGSLERLAQETQILRNGFSKHFADLFMARPKETFEKAPENVKKVLVRLAEQYYAL